MDLDDDQEEFQTYRGIPSTILLVNLIDPLNTGTPGRSLEACCRLIRHHLRLSSSHLIGVCLVGAEETDATSFASQNVTEIISLNLPNLDDYKKLQQTDVSKVSQSKELILSDALWHCSKMFANCKKQLLFRTILFLTRFDTPPITSDHNPTFNRVMELMESKIHVEVLNIAHAEYEPDDFYRKFLINASNNKDIILPKPVWNYNEIEDMMFKQSHRHLAITQLYFQFGEGFEIGVGVYSLLKSSYQPKKENLNRDTNAPVTSVNKTMKVTTEETMDVDNSEDTPKQLPLLKSELLWSVEYGSENIYFTDNEKKMISNPFGPPQLKLLGFKPASLLCKEQWFIKHGYFLFPNENIMEGSTNAFKAFHKSCIDQSVIAICVLCTRVNARPYIVALSPCVRPLGLDIEIGFDVIIIPFMEHVRQLSIEVDESTYQISQADKKTMKSIINKLQFDYKPNMFENPKLQSEYKAIEAIALEIENMDSFIDTTKPDPEKFKLLQNDLFEEIFGPFGVSNKRAGNGEGTSSKRPKIDLDNIDESGILNFLSRNNVNTCTVAQLKKILLSKPIPDLPNIKSMKKNDLIDLVYKYFGS